ncbi:MAG: histidinol-phosphatase [Gammaproteobacteria bacterium]|nr:histidinol-phosphatase [Gammaproteobacteria bacterium]
MTTPTDWAPLCDFAQALADIARPIILDYFGRAPQAARKGDNTPVTAADRDSEQVMRGLIEQRFPGHGIYGEECGIKEGTSSYLWLLDPIDGTKSFITGKPLFGTLIALLHDGVPVIGVVDTPALSRRWVGCVGQATVEGASECRVSACTELASAKLASTSIDMFAGAALNGYQRLSERVWFRTFGGDCFVYAMLASGHLDLVVEAGLAPYDYLSMVPVIEGAGGVITDWSGAPLGLNSDGKVIAAGSRELHRQVVEILAG